MFFKLVELKIKILAAEGSVKLHMIIGSLSKLFKIRQLRLGFLRKPLSAVAIMAIILTFL